MKRLLDEAAWRWTLSVHVGVIAVLGGAYLIAYSQGVRLGVAGSFGLGLLAFGLTRLLDP